MPFPPTRATSPTPLRRAASGIHGPRTCEHGGRGTNHLAVPTARLDLEYDGTEFAGWSAQPGLRTVQSEVERALAKILRGEVALTVAGRTDRGVHAWGQVASYEGEPAQARALNAVLPRDIAVVACAAAPDGFDARRDARSRSAGRTTLRLAGRAIPSTCASSAT